MKGILEHIRHQVDFNRLYEIKLDEIKLEESLIIQGVHPDYIQALSDIETRKDIKLRESADRLRYTVQNSESVFDADIKMARDTFHVFYLL